MLYELIHKTNYEYDHDVSVSHHVLRLTPRRLPWQRLLDHDILTSPAPAQMSRRKDYYGNDTLFVTIQGAHRKLSFIARSLVEVHSLELDSDAGSSPASLVRDRCENPTNLEEIQCAEFILPSPLITTHAAFADYGRSSFASGIDFRSGVLDLTRRIHRDFTFDPTATTVSTPVMDVWKQKRGVCQDFAHFQIACLRSLGLPARYVSGYLETLPPPGKPKLVGADASHAWVQCWCPELGWFDVDPTNNCEPADRHITLGWGRDFGDVSPARGVIQGGGNHSLSVAVDMTRLNPDDPEPAPPRPTPHDPPPKASAHTGPDKPWAASPSASETDS